MASSSAPHLTLSPFLSLSTTPSHKPHNSLPFSSRRSSRRFKVAAENKNIDLLGDFGARDPFPAEIESNFGDKVLGNVSTEHKILIPQASVLSLSQMQCAPISDLQHPLSEGEVKQLLYKVSLSLSLPYPTMLLLVQLLWQNQLKFDEVIAGELRLSGGK